MKITRKQLRQLIIQEIKSPITEHIEWETGKDRSVLVEDLANMADDYCKGERDYGTLITDMTNKLAEYGIN